MKVFIVYCHPSEDSFTRHIRDEFIKGQIEYQNYMLNHSDLFDLVINNTNVDVSEVSNQIVTYVKENERINSIKWNIA